MMIVEFCNYLKFLKHFSIPNNTQPIVEYCEGEVLFDGLSPRPEHNQFNWLGAL